jgi:hypothetical protein
LSWESGKIISLLAFFHFSQPMPRKQNPSSTSASKGSGSKPRVRFIFEPDRTSPNGITYSWLIHGTYNGKEKAATATRAFWLPLDISKS